MAEEKPVQEVYQYSVWYDIWLTIKKWAPRVLAVILALYILRYIVTHAPNWFASVLIGFIIALVPSYFLVSQFFRIDYMVFVVPDLKNRTLTPYFFPTKLFREGKWEIDGVKVPHKSLRLEIRDSEIDEFLNEIKQIEAEIRQKEKEKEELEKQLYDTLALENNIKKKEEHAKKLEEELRELRRQLNKKIEEYEHETDDEKARQLNNEIKKLEKKIEAKEEQIEKIYKAIDKLRAELDDKEAIRREIELLDEEIRDLIAEKNFKVEDLAWMGDEDDIKVFIADDIDFANRKIILSPLHGYSDMELLLNGKLFEQLKTMLRDFVQEYARLKANYNYEVYAKAAELLDRITSLGMETPVEEPTPILGGEAHDREKLPEGTL